MHEDVEGAPESILVCDPRFRASRYVALACQERGIPTRYITSYLYDPRSVLGRFAGRLPTRFQARVLSKLQRRALRGLEPRLVKQIPWPELGRRIGMIAFAREPRMSRSLVRLEDWAMDWMSARMLRGDEGAVYCVEGSAELTLQRAQRVGCRRFLEVTVHPDHMMHTLASEYASLGLQEGNPLTYSRERLIAEVSLADRVVTQSRFASATYSARGVSEDKLRVVPLGVDLATFMPGRESQPSQHSALRLLYVGQLSVRKGVMRLIDAVNSLKAGSAELTLIGLIDAELRPSFTRQASNSRVRVQWIPGLARHELPAHYRRADLVVLPSLCDSFGQVVLEAMACGTPVLVTSACGAPVIEGEDGWVVPPQDTAALTERIAGAVALGRKGLAELGNNAAQHAVAYSWQDFQARILEVLTEPKRYASSPLED